MRVEVHWLQPHPLLGLPERLNFPNKTFSFNEEEESASPGRREQATKACHQPQRLDFQVKDQDFEAKNEPLKTEIDERILHLFSCSKY